MTWNTKVFIKMFLHAKLFPIKFFRVGLVIVQSISKVIRNLLQIALHFFLVISVYLTVDFFHLTISQVLWITALQEPWFQLVAVVLIIFFLRACPTDSYCLTILYWHFRILGMTWLKVTVLMAVCGLRIQGSLKFTVREFDIEI